MWAWIALAAAAELELPTSALLGKLEAIALDPCPVSVSVDARGRPRVGALVDCDPAWDPVAERLALGRWSPGAARDTSFSLALGPNGKVVAVARVGRTPVAQALWAERAPVEGAVTIVPWVGVAGVGRRMFEGDDLGPHRVGVRVDAARAVVFVTDLGRPETRVASFDATIVPASAWTLGVALPERMVDPPEALVSCVVRLSLDSDLAASPVADCPAPWNERVAGWFRSPDPVAGRFDPPARGCVQVWLAADGSVDATDCPDDDVRAVFTPSAPWAPAPVGAVLGGSDLSCRVTGNVGPDGLPVEIAATGCVEAAASAAVEAVLAVPWRGRALTSGRFTSVVEVPARQVIGPRSAEFRHYSEVRVLRQETPEFPSQYADTSTSRCTLRLRVEGDGRVGDAHITGCPEGFAASADRAIRRWLFEAVGAPYVTELSLFFAGPRARR